MNPSIDSYTPSVSATHPQGQAIRQIAYLRKVAGEDAQALITRQHHDVGGRTVTERDPRLSIASQVTVFALSGQPLRVQSVDAGTSLVLPGRSGEETRRWDARGNHWLTTYDNQLRPLTVEENGTPDIETFTYADRSADPGHNLRGQLIRREDPSGSVDVRSFGLSGQALRETRTFHDGNAFVSGRRYSPLGAVLTQTDAGGHQQQSTYDVAGQLNRVQLQINGQTTWQTVLQDAQYNASGQLIEQQAGNGVTSHWHYRAADGRLHCHRAQKGSGPVLQDFKYEYDRVGNIVRILDHAYTPTYFSNQRVDGHQEFDYDTLYRLISATGYSDATPSDRLGLPQSTNPDDRRNYVEHYDYDHGDNLVKTIPVRDGTSHTFEMCIDPASNRGVRWKPGDPPPDFSQRFDPAGNLRALQPGVPMHWNAHGELDKVTLVDRNGSSANDEEYYRYSRGQRVYKRHDTHTTKVSHFHEVRYLPGLEIRTKDNGEELHVITLDIGSGAARCLHWKKDPAKIGADQLRFTLPDHLGSAVRELDAQARLITDERYLPFGGTAVYTRHSAVEVDYKTVRYSGKEMDVTRLYYYGARYYADWLGRWVSADRAGTVDGLNLYAFVGNNPIIHVDKTGNVKVLFDVAKGFIGVLDKAATAAGQLDYLAREFDGLVPEDADINELRESITFGTFMKSRHGIKSALYGAAKGAGVGAVLGTALPGIGNLIGTAVGTLVGAIAFPLLRYHFFKKSLKAVETLRTREIAAGVTAVADTAANVVEGTKNLINGAGELQQRIKAAADNLGSYPQRLQEMFYRQLDDLMGDQQREVMKLLKTGLDPFDAIDQVLSTARQLVDSPSEADGVTARLAELLQSAQQDSHRPLKKPIPKPRTKMQPQLQRRMSETYV